MNDHDPIRDVAIEALAPVMEQTPDHPHWDSMQFETLHSVPYGRTRWWIAAVAAAVVILVGTGIAVISNTSTGQDVASPPTTQVSDALPPEPPEWLIVSFERGASEYEKARVADGVLTDEEYKVAWDDTAACMVGAGASIIEGPRWDPTLDDYLLHYSGATQSQALAAARCELDHVTHLQEWWVWQRNPADFAPPISTRVTMEALKADPGLLYYPTLIPAGWELCRQIEDIDQGDRFCDPDDDEAWLQVAVKDSGVVPTDGAPFVSGSDTAVWLDHARFLEIATPVGAFQTLVVSSNALSDDDIVVVFESIPLVANRAALYGSYEVHLDLDAVSDEQLAALLTQYDPNPQVAGRRWGEAQIHTPT
ncbi:MAG: hypothetical protein U9R51_00915, partial [Actinomycetota bacterium]|nr:hypothetical protein [Actinomycetota bacterium]